LACRDAFTGCKGVVVRIDKRSFNEDADIVRENTVGFLEVSILFWIPENSQEVWLSSGTEK
jgi:hypothetical protein